MTFPPKAQAAESDFTQLFLLLHELYRKGEYDEALNDENMTGVERCLHCAPSDDLRSLMNALVGAVQLRKPINFLSLHDVLATISIAEDKFRRAIRDAHKLGNENLQKLYKDVAGRLDKLWSFYAPQDESQVPSIAELSECFEAIEGLLKQLDEELATAVAELKK